MLIMAWCISFLFASLCVRGGQQPREQLEDGLMILSLVRLNGVRHLLLVDSLFLSISPALYILFIISIINIIVLCISQFAQLL